MNPYFAMDALEKDALLHFIDSWKWENSCPFTSSFT